MMRRCFRCFSWASSFLLACFSGRRAIYLSCLCLITILLFVFVCFVFGCMGLLLLHILHSWFLLVHTKIKRCDIWFGSWGSGVDGEDSMGYLLCWSVLVCPVCFWSA
jgi:hypothetical protein